MKEYIEREATKNEMLHTMAGTGYQSLAMDVIRYAPTADVVEVKHGEWEKLADILGVEILKCSVCGVAHPRQDTAFCCDCGAKMDGKGK